MQNQTKNLQEPGHAGRRKTRQAGHWWVELRGYREDNETQVQHIKAGQVLNAETHKDRKKTQGTET